MNQISFKSRWLITSLLPIITFSIFGATYLFPVVETFIKAQSSFVLVSSFLAVNFIFAVATYFYVSRSCHPVENESLVLEKELATIAGTSDQVKSTSDDLSTAAQEQASSLEQTVTAVDEISSMVSRNSDNAKSSLEMAKHCEENALRGKSTISSMNEAIQKISDGNDKITTQMYQGNEQFAEIAEVIKSIAEKTAIINDIVFQTKLLSFNASVEAARAGEHGKGFSVVAEEIGNLASVSGNAANEISGLVDESVEKVERITQQMKKEVDVLMEDARSNMERGTDTVRECANAFDRVVDDVQKVNAMVQDIFQASKEQSLGVNEISDAMNSLNNVTQRNSLVAGQSHQVAGSLNDQTHKVHFALDGLLKAIHGAKNVKKFILSRMPWTSDFLLSVDAMDDEHEKLVGLINEFIDAMNEDDDSLIKETFNAMASYTIEHFRTEEAFMRSIQYPGYEGHKKIHERMLDSVAKYGKDIENGILDKKKINSFLQNWLISHIKGVDMQYANFHNSTKDKFAA